MKMVIVYMLLVLAEVVVFSWGWFNGLIAFTIVVVVINKYTEEKESSEKDYAKLGKLIVKKIEKF